MKILISTLLATTLLVFSGCDQEDNNKGNSDNKTFNLSEYPVTSNLSVEVKKTLAYMGNEERLAYDVYNLFYTLYPEQKQFVNIPQKSEIKHIEIAQSLVQRYTINDSSINDSSYTSLDYQNTKIEDMEAGVYGVDTLQTLYNSLITEGSVNVIEALKVGCKIEVIDVDDLDADIILANNDNAVDIVAAFNVLRDGSYNHYWSFDKGLKSLGITNGCNLGVAPFTDKNGIYPQK
jgi:hypothetical protein